MTDPVAPAAAVVRQRLGGRTPEAWIVLGSGLGALADRVRDAVRLPYGDVPGFPRPTVAGHRGELVLGRLRDRLVVVQSGRFHLYEGHAPATAALPARVAGALGTPVLMLTNAAGGIRRDWAAGTIMLIRDHLNLTGRNPLVGPVRPPELRFPDLTVAWDAELRGLARQVAERAGLELQEGVYAGLLGPSYETPAEIRMLELLGADAVGMSTVMEAIAARALGLRCLGISTITNAAAGQSGVPLSHEEVTQAAGAAGAHVAALIEGVLAALPPGDPTRSATGYDG